MLTMQKDIDAPFVRAKPSRKFLPDADVTTGQVPQSAFELAARTARRQITLDMMERYHSWSEKTGLTHA